MSTERNGLKSARSLESVALLAVVGRFFCRISMEDEGGDCSWFSPLIHQSVLMVFLQIFVG